MLTFLLKQLEDWGYAGLFILLFVVAFFAIWKIAKFLGRWESKDEDVSNLKSKWDIDIPEIKGKLQAIQATLDVFMQKTPSSPVIAKSPAS